RQKILPKATGNVREKIACAIKIPCSRCVPEIDEGRFDALTVTAELHRMIAANVGKDLLKLEACLATIGSAAGRSSGHEGARHEFQRIVDSDQHHRRRCTASRCYRRCQS